MRVCVREVGPPSTTTKFPFALQANPKVDSATELQRLLITHISVSPSSSSFLSFPRVDLSINPSSNRQNGQEEKEQVRLPSSACPPPPTMPLDEILEHARDDD